MDGMEQIFYASLWVGWRGLWMGNSTRHSYSTAQAKLRRLRGVDMTSIVSASVSNLAKYYDRDIHPLSVHHT